MNCIDNGPIIINDIQFNIKENVKSISTYYDDSSKNIICYETPSNNDKVIYFLLETFSHAAFAHWVFESAIFLPYFKYFKGAKLLLNKNPHRKYKALFLKLFDIDENDILFLDNIDLYRMDYENIPINNICIIPPHSILSAKKYNEIELQLYNNLIHDFKNIIISQSYSYDKSIEHLLLPRNTVENYAPNDRTSDYSPITSMLNGKEYMSYNTMDTEDMRDQLLLVSKAENIYLEFGSALLVNGFFSKNANIYVVNKMEAQCIYYPFKRCILNVIERENKIIYLDNIFKINHLYNQNKCYKYSFLR